MTNEQNSDVKKSGGSDWLILIAIIAAFVFMSGKVPSGGGSNSGPPPAVDGGLLILVDEYSTTSPEQESFLAAARAAVEPHHLVGVRSLDDDLDAVKPGSPLYERAKAKGVTPPFMAVQRGGDLIRCAPMPNPQTDEALEAFLK